MNTCRRETKEMVEGQD